MRKIVYLIVLICHFSFSQNEEIDFDSFKGEKSEIIITKKFKYSRLYDYKIESENGDSLMIKQYVENIPENLLALKYNAKLEKNQPRNIVFAISLISKLEIDVNQDSFVFIKYKLKESDNLSSPKVIVLKSNNTNWKESFSDQRTVKYLKDIIENTNVRILYSFYSKRNNKRYPEINKLKPLVKDANGVIIIEKLAKVIKDNKTSLSKYLE